MTKQNKKTKQGCDYTSGCDYDDLSGVRVLERVTAIRCVEAMKVLLKKDKRHQYKNKRSFSFTHDIIATFRGVKTDNEVVSLHYYFDNNQVERM